MAYYAIKADEISPERRAAFWSFVDKTERCWNWTGSKTPSGYGQLRLHGQARPAHRIAYALAHGEAPADLFICHDCDNPGCVRPDHLFPGTHTENMADMDRKGRRKPGVVPRGAAQWLARFTDEQIIAIRMAWAAGTSQHSLAATYNTTQSHIQSIVTGQSWRHLPLFPRPDYQPPQRVPDDVRAQIRALYANGSMTQADLVRTFGLAQPTISRLVKGLCGRTASKGQRGEEHHNARFTDTTIAQVHRLAAAGHSQRVIAERLGMDASHVSRILRGQSRA